MHLKNILKRNVQKNILLQCYLYFVHFKFKNTLRRTENNVINNCFLKKQSFLNKKNFVLAIFGILIERK